MAYEQDVLTEMSSLLAKLTELGVVSKSAVSIDNIFVLLTDDGRAYFAIIDKFWKELCLTDSAVRIQCLEILLDMLVRKEGEADEPPTDDR